MNPADDKFVPRGVSIGIGQIKKSFGDRSVFESLDLNVGAGEFLSVLGPSGCGKSTLLRLVAGLDSPDSGRIELRGRAEVGCVFQEPHLMPWRTVLQNVTLPLEFRAMALADRTRRARAALSKVNLEGVEDLYPNQLSGGMKMRVSLARALVTDPTLLLLDEPFAALDEVNRYHLEEELRDIWKSLGSTVIFVTHSITEAAFLSQRIVLLSGKKVGAAFPVGLPAERESALRISPEFGKIVGSLQRAVEESGI